MASRSGLRFAQQTLRQPVFRTNISRFGQRRSQQTAAENVQAAKEESQSAISKFLNSNVGPKTVHFWAPIMKWGLVLAGAADFARPAESLSLTQNAALMATGLIWTRWCFVIKPRNVFLASVNFALFCVGATQVFRVVSYKRSLGEGLGDIAKDEGKAAEKAVERPKNVVDSVKNGK
nr:mitochondrial pyruvate carrier 3 [Quercus suber]